MNVEITPDRRPPGKGHWIDGRTGLVILGTMAATVILNFGYSFRNPTIAAEQYPFFDWFASWFRVLTYVAIGPITAPVNWALRGAWLYLLVILSFNILLLVFAFFDQGASIIAPAAYGSVTLKVSALLSATILCLALRSSLSATYRAGVETTRRYEWSK